MRLKKLVGLSFIVVGSVLLFNMVGLVSAQDTPDLTHLPIGDGKVSTTPQVGYIYLCNTQPMGQGGAGTDGPWIHSDGTFDLTAKATVDGAVEWPEHAFTITLDGNTRHITTNDLPDHTTGTFPIASTDDAYQYDRNPNSIKTQNYVADLPTMPVTASQPTCLTGGTIGVTLSGTVIFDGLDAGNRDAVAHETQDSCQGHPQQEGAYHYHNLSSCIPDTASGQSALMGYALDGFGIYGPRDASGKILSNADLDECHGTTSEVDWDGQKVTIYHYVATYEYPYTLGCYRGTPIRLSGEQMGGPLGQGGNGQQGQCGNGQQGQPPAQNGNGQQGQPPAQNGNGQQGQPPQGGQGQNGQGQPPQGANGPCGNGQQGQPPQGGQGQNGQGQPPPQNGNGQQGQPPQGGRPDLAAAAAKLGITEQTLRDALGAPPPDLQAAAAKLGITVQALTDALGVPPPR